MVSLGYLLITAGFLAGSYFAVVQVEGVPWGGWALGVGVGALGVVLARLGSRRSAQTEERVQGNLAAIAESLTSVVEKAGRLNAERGGMDVYDVHHRIDELFMDDLNRFVEARESLRHRFGVQAYAEVLTAFATGERALNRAWSASTDGYVDEVARSLGKAETQFHDALEKFHSLS